MFNQLSERSTTEGRETDRVKGREGFLSLRPSVASNVDCEESCIGFSPLSVLSGFAAVLVVAQLRVSLRLVAAQTAPARMLGSLLPPRIESRSDVCYRCQSTFLRFRRLDENRPRHGADSTIPPRSRFPHFLLPLPIRVTASFLSSLSSIRRMIRWTFLEFQRWISRIAWYMAVIEYFFEFLNVIPNVVWVGVNAEGGDF